jgi:formamidopyrimidine-DNA glycosylase
VAKSRERSEVESLRGLIRQLKSENRHLKKELARAEKNTKKQISMYAELTDATDASYATPELAVDDDTPSCIKCGSSIKETDLGTRILYVCQKATCNHRQILIKKKLD